MRLLKFSTRFPDEASCIAKMRKLREAAIHICPKCGYAEWHWKGCKLCYECKRCRRGGFPALAVLGV